MEHCRESAAGLVRYLSCFVQLLSALQNNSESRGGFGVIANTGYKPNPSVQLSLLKWKDFLLWDIFISALAPLLWGVRC